MVRKSHDGEASLGRESDHPGTKKPK
jgi:hypothetical protein